MWPPFWSVTHSLIDSLNRREKTCPSPEKGRAPPQAINYMFCKRCGVGKIYNHYGDGPLLCAVLALVADKCGLSLRDPSLSL